MRCTRVVGALCLIATAACGRKPEPQPNAGFEPPRSLAALRIVSIERGRVIPAEGVLELDLNTPLFADYASVHRHVKLPPGTAIRFVPPAGLEFPAGTILAKTLAYPRDMRVALGPERAVETQLLVLEEGGWRALPYVWNHEQTDARLKLAGGLVDVSWIHADGAQRTNQHLVANVNQCKNCHWKGPTLLPLGMRVDNLNRPRASGGENQLSRLARLGLLAGLPRDGREWPRLAVWDQVGSDTLGERARAYLHVNCAHCHNPEGAARNSNLDLRYANEDPLTRGIMKTPVSAGRGAGPFRFDIVPGKPEESILVYRLKSVDPGVVMPEFGKRQVHEEGVRLISEWIRSLPPHPSAEAGLVGIVDDLRPEQLAAYAAEVLARGDARRGEAVFQLESLNCKKCHAVRGVGGNVGPDLAKIGPPATPAMVIESLLLPGKTIREGFRAVTVQTVDGLAVTGIQVADREGAIVLRDPVRGDSVIPKSDIEERSEGASLMPSNVTATLKRQDLLDLARYVVELNQETAADHARGGGRTD